MWFEGILGHQIYSPSEPFTQTLLKFQKLEEPHRSIELNQDVNVTVARASPRTNDPKMPISVTP